MKVLSNLFRSLFIKKQLPLLGRWRIVYCDKTLHRKIDLANEDNCGPCGDFKIIKKQESKK